MTEETQDQRVARATGAHPDQVRFAREEWNGSTNAVFIREIIKDRLTRQITDRYNKLKTTDPENLRRLQGELAGIELALSLSTITPLQNE